MDETGLGSFLTAFYFSPVIYVFVVTCSKELVGVNGIQTSYFSLVEKGNCVSSVISQSRKDIDILRCSKIRIMFYNIYRKHGLK